MVLPRISSDDAGKFVAIDIITSEFEVDSDELKACERLRRRLPEAQIWLVKIGSRYVHRFPLIGMRLLDGYELTVQVQSSGVVTIKPLD